MQYIGEHTFAGEYGHLFVILSFVFSFVAALNYLLAALNPESKSAYIKSARLAFFAHVLSTLAFVFFIFYMLFHHYNEFQYIWEQSSEDMSFRYILVCFWGGQEGSFMLWIFWHTVIGSIFIFSAKKYEPYVMTVFSLVQFFLVSMLLGVYIGEWKIGSSPFALRRETDLNLGPFWNTIPDYLSFDENMRFGRGLNPLLRNYWMTIHPPTLFLGFALTLIPFCYAIAGLWTKNYREWIKPALPWTFFGIMVLGGGILMGGRWAYESLSFGGFWAWDPVENASLVPWIILLAAGHLMLINQNKNNSIYSTILFTCAAFILILLSTFLTRSGVLGESSVHSFTGEAMLGQLLLYLMFFIWLPIHLILINKKLRLIFNLISASLLICVFAIDTQTSVEIGTLAIPIRGILFIIGSISVIALLSMGYAAFVSKENENESISAREFWMFIGAIILVLSSFHIIYNTCQPVINMLFGSEDVIAQDERNEFYNKFQVPFALVVGLIMAFTQYLKYKKTDTKQFLKQILVSFVLSLILTFALYASAGFKNYIPHLLLFFASIFAVIANFNYFILISKGKIKKSGSSIAHVGFGLMLIGALISQANQKIISKNYKGYVLDFLDKEGGIKNAEDVQLFKGEMTSMGEYFVVFNQKRVEKDHLYFDIDYYEQLPHQYKKGDRVRFNFDLYECNSTHRCDNEFLNEINFWKKIEANDANEYYSYQTWESHKPGKLLFVLHPFVQLNKMSNVAEPGTMSTWSFDVFTHIKYADLSPITTGKMPALKMTGKTGDTLWTAGYKIIFNNPSQLIDSSGKIFGAQLNLTILNVLDSKGKYPITALPTYIFDDNGNISTPVFKLNNLGVEIKLVKINPNSNNNSKTTFDIEFTTPEYLVLHARTFPWIILLWYGCIIMCFGTFIAVISRIRTLKNA